MNSHQPLAGKRALVTGGSRGIGAAIVRRLVADGAQVAFTYASSAAQATALAGELDGRALPLQADSADAGQLRAAIAQAAQALGGIDILVSSAGILIRGDVAGYALEDFDRMLDVNVRAAFVAVQAVLPHMPAGGRIVTVGSMVADLARYPGASVYALTKGALASFVRGLAHDLGPRGITVNNLQPGPTQTDIATAEVFASLAPQLPIGRVGQGHEVAAFAAWLCGPEASFVTGASLTVDGGFSA